MSIVVKIKYVNSGNISDNCDKLNFITNYAHVITTDTHLIKTQTNVTIFDTFDGTISPRDLSSSDSLINILIDYIVKEIKKLSNDRVIKAVWRD